jgi:acetyltransferase-like isoleucine patch superfamily enzyme
MTRPDPDIRTAPVVIGRGAFIGTCSIILKGVTIGEYSVIAAGSVVVTSVPDGEIWGGNPAKFIKRLED